MLTAASESSSIEQSTDISDAGWLLERLDIQRTDAVLEVATGTRLLTRHLAGCNPQGMLYVHDRSPQRLQLNQSKWAHLRHLRFTTDLAMIREGSCDKAASLGGWHQVEDQIGTLREVLQRLRTGGRFGLGDFADGSSIQGFLDEVVDRAAPGGHRALFVSESRLINLGRFVRASHVEIASFEVPFAFDSKRAIGVFFQKTFALDLHPLEILEDVHNYFVIERLGNSWSVLMPHVYAIFHK